MRICYFVAEVATGVGVSGMLSEILRYSADRWDSEVITPQRRDLAVDDPLKSASRQSQRYYLAVLDESTRRSVDRADVVQIVNGFPYFLPVLRSRKPTVYTLMQPDPTWLFDGVARLKRYAVRALENRWLLNRVDALVSLSPWVADWYRNRFGVDSLVVPPVLDARTFVPPASTEVSPDEVGLLTVGGWDGYRGRKRTHELVSALPGVVRALPNVRLTLVGLSPPAATELGELARRLGVSDRIVLRGKVGIGELVAAYQHATVYVAPTLVEGFYRPIVEAFACKVPGVARDGLGAVDPVCLSALHHVEESGAGDRYDGSAESLVAAIERVLARRTELGRRGREYALRFEAAKVLPPLEALYTRLHHTS